MKKLLFSLSIMIFAVAFLTGCKQDPSSSSIMTMKAPPPANAHPEIALTGTTTSKNTSYQTIAVMDSDGANLTNVFTASTVNQSLHRPTWSGNGNEIVFFETDLGSTTARTTLKKFTVTVTNGVATGGTATTLVTKSSTDNSIWTAEWSPSTTNSQIAYTTIASGGAHGSTLYTVAGTGGASTLVTSSSDCNFTGITWNSGASKIAIVCQYFTSPTSDTVSYYCIKIVNTSGVLQDSIGIANYKGILANNIEWSRTGIDQLAYTTAVFTNGGTEFLSGTDSVLVQDASSAGTAAFAVAGQHATWSPTNWKLAYNSATGISTVITASGTTASISTTGNMPNWKK